MTTRQTLIGLLFAGIASIAQAADSVNLNMSDVYFQWRPMPKGTAVCGYAILGNHLSHDDPKVEWDINVDELVQGDQRLAAVSAGTFLVSGKARAPRSPIVELSFTIEDNPEPLPARLAGAPNKDNGVRGTLDIDRAAELFKAFSNEDQITASFKYADGTADLLKFRGIRDARKFGRGRNSPFEECLRGIVPKIVHPTPAP